MKRNINISWMLALFGLLVFSGTIYSKGDLVSQVKETIQMYYDQPFSVSQVKENTVQILGDVNTLYDKYRIYDLAATVPGVRHIIDDVQIDSSPIPDDIVQSNIKWDMRLEPAILEPDLINVNVSNGIAYLTGQVTYKKEKSLMSSIASWQNGVRAIINTINVMPKKIARSDGNMTEVADEVITKDFPIEEDVHVLVKDGVAYLNGQVDSKFTKESLQKSLSVVQGIKSVRNGLVVVNSVS